ncbi:MAG: hypothetical protein KDA65_07515 [Planctomycetaceae bacterium]|nr:hypothetical protein [Planctomycetaceae bacterium]
MEAENRLAHREKPLDVCVDNGPNGEKSGRNQEVVVVLPEVDPGSLCGSISISAGHVHDEAAFGADAEKVAPAAENNSEESEEEDSSKVRFVIHSLMMKCQGHSTAVNSLPWYRLETPQTFKILFDVEDRQPLCSITSPCRLVEPPEPVPKV